MKRKISSVTKFNNTLTATTIIRSLPPLYISLSADDNQKPFNLSEATKITIITTTTTTTKIYQLGFFFIIQRVIVSKMV